MTKLALFRKGLISLEKRSQHFVDNFSAYPSQEPKVEAIALEWAQISIKFCKAAQSLTVSEMKSDLKTGQRARDDFFDPLLASYAKTTEKYTAHSITRMIYAFYQPGATAEKIDALLEKDAKRLGKALSILDAKASPSIERASDTLSPPRSRKASASPKPEHRLAIPTEETASASVSPKRKRAPSKPTTPQPSTEDDIAALRGKMGSGRTLALNLDNLSPQPKTRKRAKSETPAPIPNAAPSAPRSEKVPHRTKKTKKPALESFADLTDEPGLQHRTTEEIVNEQVALGFTALKNFSSSKGRPRANTLETSTSGFAAKHKKRSGSKDEANHNGQPSSSHKRWGDEEQDKKAKPRTGKNGRG